jgi:hypothetical protein
VARSPTDNGPPFCGRMAAWCVPATVEVFPLVKERVGLSRRCIRNAAEVRGTQVPVLYTWMRTLGDCKSDRLSLTPAVAVVGGAGAPAALETHVLRVRAVGSAGMQYERRHGLLVSGQGNSTIITKSVKSPTSI